MRNFRELTELPTYLPTYLPTDRQTDGQKLYLYTVSTHRQICPSIEPCVYKLNDVTMAMSSFIKNVLPSQVVPRYILGKVTKFGDFRYRNEKVINVQSPCGRIIPPPPRPMTWLKGVNVTILENRYFAAEQFLGNLSSYT